MCLTAFAFHPGPELCWLIAHNRDEFRDRASAPLHAWDGAPNASGADDAPLSRGIVAGRDARAGGAWFGINHQLGRVAWVTNVRDPGANVGERRSRGDLVLQALQRSDDIAEIAAEVARDSDDYGGFNLVIGERARAIYISSVTGTAMALAPGVYGLSNGALDTPWPKVVRIKEAMAQLLTEGEVPGEDALFAMLTDTDRAADHALPDTGVGVAMERMLSPIFIPEAKYGTRSSTVLTWRRSDEVEIVEKTWEPPQVWRPPARRWQGRMARRYVRSSL